ncbi:DNA-directed RNA polymerase subunit beta [Candidatus Dojkabacteria bacterium]|nr:DNA-directed RNA polymerase subunit beta [Candidatus Dojkabacteria bacterium]
MSPKTPFAWGNYKRRGKVERVNLGFVKRISDPPSLLVAQFNSFEWFKQEGIDQLFSLVNPITDPTGSKWEVKFLDFRFGEPNRTEDEALLRELSYDAPVYSTIRLTNKRTGIVKEKEIFLLDFPVITQNGGFVHNGVSRAVIHQLIRAEGVSFMEAKNSTHDRALYMAKLRPQRGSWIEFVVNRQGVIFIKLMQGNVRIPLTMLLKALGRGSNSELLELFADVDIGEIKYIESCLKYDLTVGQEDAALTIYRMLRSDETVGVQTAIRYIRGLFFDSRKFYLGRVGRYQMCKKFGKKLVEKEKFYKLTVDDIIDISKRLIEINNGNAPIDDIDALTNRRIRSVGELFVSQLEQGVLRMEKNIRDRLSMYGDDAKINPKQVVNAKPLRSVVDMFLGTNSLSRFMDQENILAELENKRRVTASGQGGVSSDRATFSIRDIHFSQYGRMCPVKTPEKMNIGVVTHLGLYSRINDYGFIEVMYRVVKSSLSVGKDSILNRIPREDIKAGSKILIKAGELITNEIVKSVEKELKGKDLLVRPFITNKIIWVDPYQELELVSAPSTVEQDEHGNILAEIIPARNKGTFGNVYANELNIVDVSPSQVGSASLALIPFAGNTDSARLLMGTNMTNQAVPLVTPEAPIVGTGFERFVAKESGWGIYADFDGEITYVDAETIELSVKGRQKQKYKLTRFKQSNQNTSFTQLSKVSVGDKVKKGDLLADGPSMANGELSIGRNLLVAYMFMDGFNFEDGFVISDRLVKHDLLTSVHVSTHSVDVRETKLGPEVITRDIPGVSERALRHLDDNGIVRVGANVTGGDVLVGIIAPKGEHELSAEEKLLRAIFGEPSREVADNSLRVPYGEDGVVTKVHILSSEKGDRLNAGVIKQVKVWIASTKKVSFGDKLAGRYGDKGTVTKILPAEDMPYIEGGRTVDVVLNPLVIKRMNLGQILETYFSNVAYSAGVNVAMPSFEDYDKEWFNGKIKELGLSDTNKVNMYDGRTGEKFDQQVAVGWRYLMRLKHIASEKIHARSTGPYTMVTQQPLAGRSHRGGQRFGEMEVWALEAYGAAHTLQEMLTIKSDDVDGRSAAYKAILSGEKVEVVKVPASFSVLVRELNSLGLNVELLRNPKEEWRSEDKPELDTNK